MVILDLGKVDGKPLEIVHDGPIPQTYTIQECQGPPPKSLWDDPFQMPMVRDVVFVLQAIEGPNRKGPAVAFYSRRPERSIWSQLERHNRP